MYVYLYIGRELMVHCIVQMKQSSVLEDDQEMEMESQL